MQVTSVEQLLEVLGGYRQVSRMFGAADHTALMWRDRKKLPSRTFVVLMQELSIRGHTAPPSLWGMAAKSAHRRNGKARK